MIETCKHCNKMIERICLEPGGECYWHTETRVIDCVDGDVLLDTIAEPWGWPYARPA